MKKCPAYNLFTLRAFLLLMILLVEIVISLQFKNDLDKDREANNFEMRKAYLEKRMERLSGEFQKINNGDDVNLYFPQNKERGNCLNKLSHEAEVLADKNLDERGELSDSCKVDNEKVFAFYVTGMLYGVWVETKIDAASSREREDIMPGLVQDKYRFYLRGCIYEGFDEKTLESLDFGYAKNKNNYYFHGKILPKNYLCSDDLREINNPSGYHNSSYITDGCSLFKSGVKINIPLDLKTLTVIGGGAFRDESNLYFIEYSNWIYRFRHSKKLKENVILPVNVNLINSLFYTKFSRPLFGYIFDDELIDISSFEFISMYHESALYFRDKYYLYRLDNGLQRLDNFSGNIQKLAYKHGLFSDGEHCYVDGYSQTYLNRVVRKDGTLQGEHTIKQVSCDLLK